MFHSDRFCLFESAHCFEGPLLPVAGRAPVSRAAAGTIHVYRDYGGTSKRLCPPLRDTKLAELRPPPRKLGGTSKSEPGVISKFRCSSRACT